MSRPGGMNLGNNMMPPNMNPSMGSINNMGGMNNMGGGMNPMGGGGMNNMGGGGGMGNMGGGMRNNGMGGGQGGGMNPQQMNMFQNPYGKLFFLLAESSYMI